MLEWVFFLVIELGPWHCEVEAKWFNSKIECQEGRWSIPIGIRSSLCERRPNA